jgi:hypothetical protein
LEHDGSCSEGGGSFTGQVRSLRNTEFSFQLATKVPLHWCIICFGDCPMVE